MQEVMNKNLYFFILFIAFLIEGCNTNIPSSEEDENDSIVETQMQVLKEQQKYADIVLKDPAAFDKAYDMVLDDLGVTITESPDSNVRFYTWWDGEPGTMICHNNIYQTKYNNKVRAFDWRNEDENYYPNYILAIRQIESSKGMIYLLISGFTEWSSCHAFEVSAFRMDRHGELKPVCVFDKVDALPDVESDEELNYRVYIEIYGIEPPSLFIDNGWSDNFFFDLSGKDVYLPNMEDNPDGRSFNDYYHHFHWNGEKFEYLYLKYNPILEQYVEPSDQLACEFDLGKSFIRIEKMRDGTYRYIVWTREKMFTDEPDLVIENGWYHEVERVFHFTNNDHEYVIDASEYRLHIYRTDSKTGKTEEIANYHIDEVYSQIPGAF